MKKIIGILLGCLCLAAIANAQITIDDFSTAPAGLTTYSSGWTGQVTTSGGLLTVGGTADDAGSMLYSTIIGGAFNASAQSFDVSVTARIDSGNTASAFAIVLFDDGGVGTRIAQFSTLLFSTSLSTQTLTLSAYSTGNPINTTYYGIAGVGAGSGLVHITFDSITVSPTAVPEPSTYAGIAGLLALGFVAWRRRSAHA